jgi:predicted DNA binding CopG/RHH family protein
MKEELKNRNFKSEADEARFWDENPDALAEAFEKAAAEGTLGHGTTARKGGTRTTTIRLDPNDIRKARILAERLGLKYQTYLKMLIREALNLKFDLISREQLEKDSHFSHRWKG